MEIVTQLESIGSCLTGQISVIGLRGYKMKFSMENFPKPDDFPGDFPGDLPADLPADFAGGMMDFKPPMEFKDMMNKLPMKSVFSQIISSINTIIVFLIPIFSILTLIHFIFKKKRHYKNIEKVQIDSIPILDDSYLETVFSYGYQIVE